MELFLPPGVTLFAFVLSLAITAGGGFIKGAVGFAQPLVMISFMGIFLPPQIVVAGMIIPLILANFMQVRHVGWSTTWMALKEFRFFIAIVCLTILVSAQFLTRIPGDTMFLVLGIPVVMLCLVQLFGFRPDIPKRLRPAFSVVSGLMAGVLGGLSGTWGAPTVLYLLAVETPKAQQMAAQGVIYGLGGLALAVGHFQSGVFNAQTWGFSAALVLPSLLGMWLGFRVHDRLDQELFRKVTLIVLTIAGFNLIRKGLMG